MAEEITKQGQIDEDVKMDLKQQVDLGLSNEKQMRRTELNYYCEFLSSLREMNKNLSELHNTINMLGEDKLMAYFKEVNENFRKEEANAKCRKKVSMEHQKPKK